MANEKIVLSKPTEYELRGGVCVKVYPASLETISQITPKLDNLDKVAQKTKDLSKQVDAFVDVVYELVKDDNDVTKAALKKALTVEACTRIIQSAMGALGSVSA